MKYKMPKGRPEGDMSDKLRRNMSSLGWHTDKTHGSAYQSGFPDIYATHRIHGVRWIETKTPGGYLRASQIAKFQQWTKHGTGIWVITRIEEYEWLFGPPNWHLFLPGQVRPVVITK